MDRKTDRVMQIGNLIPSGDMARKFDNPQRGRVFSTEGISPCVCTHCENDIKILI